VEKDDPDSIDTGEDRPRRGPAFALARAIWSEQAKTDANLAGSKAARAEDWKARRKAYANQARRIIKHLEEQGYSVSEKP
jgi:primase-polymerase (primpol)-like protein